MTKEELILKYESAKLVYEDQRKHAYKYNNFALRDQYKSLVDIVSHFIEDLKQL